MAGSKGQAASPYDVKGLLKTAIATENPTVFVNHPRLFDEKGEVPAGDYAVHVEVVDPRTIVPLDLTTILESVAKTGRMVVADECHRSCGVAAELSAFIAELSAFIAEHAFDSLKAPIKRVTFPDAPAPFSPVLEKALEPTADKLAAATRRIAR